MKNINVNSNTATTITASDSAKTDNATTTAAAGDNTKTVNTATTTDTGNSTKTDNTATTADTGNSTKTDNTATTAATGDNTKTDNTATTAATGDNTKTDNTATTAATGDSTKTDNTATTADTGNSTKTDNTATTTAVGDSAKTDNIMASSAANNNLPNNTTVQVSYQNLLTQLSSSSELNADSEALTNVTKDNFEDYFSLNGSATYDQTTGIVTITPDKSDKVGNFSLKSKIDMNTSFTLTGQINLGNRTSSQGGADGIGFAFHNGNTTDIGNAGGNLGIGGLQKAIGFKLDTYHNGYRTPQANEDGAQVASTDSNGYGWDTDPDGTKFPQFGAFVDTSQKLIQAQDGHYYSRWWAKTDMSSVQELNSGDLDGQFHDFVVSYDGSNRKLTIKYTETGGNVLTWSTSIPDTYQAMAMVVSASTGYFKNLQQFKISSFDFKQAATVNVKYVDTKGNQIAQGEVTYPNGANVNGTYTTGQLEIPNYKFVRMDDGTATGAKSLPATGTLTKAGDNGTVIYVYAPAYTQTSKTISETIKYIDQDGKEVAIGYTADPITFVTVTNPVDNTTTTYYSTKAKTATLDDNGVPTEAGWTKADSTDFAEVVNPEVDGYKVISNDAPNSDLTSVAIQTVDNTSDDLNFTVVYAPAYSTSEVKTVTETVHYIGQDDKPVANDASAIPTSFVTITNPIDGSTATYYSKTESGQPTLDNNGVPVGDWTQGNSTDFAAIINPSVIGQHVVSTTDPGNDLTQTTVKRIDSNSDNLDFTVTYTANQEAANVTYIDDTTGKTLSAKDLTGDYGSTDPYRTGDTIADYEKQGYQLVSDNYPTNGVVYNQDGTVQSFEVHLTHGTTPVGPNNPQTPGEPINPDNPDGPKWPEGTDKSSLTQTVIRTVNYLDKQTGKVVAKQVTEQVTYNRTAIVDKVTGQIIGYSTTGGDTVDQTDGDKAWTAVDNKSDWDSVTSPDLGSKGYLAPDLATVAQQTVTPGDKDVTVNVYYDHDVVPVNPTNPQTPGTPINPDDPDSPKWPAGTDKNSLTTDVHQTIHYQYGDGSQAAPDKTDSTTFDHQVEIDKVTGEIVKDDGWTSENGKTSFDSKNSPVIPGYTASKLASDSVDGLTHDSKDNVQTIIYTSNQESANVTYIDDTTGKTLSAKALTGDYGSTDPYRTGDTIADYEKQGYQLVSDNYPAKGVVYNQDGTVQSFEVHLTHGTTQTSESQTVNETIHYVYKNGDKAADDYQATPLNFTRTVTTDKVTGEKTYGSWSADQSFAAVTSPTIKGYTPDQAQIDTITGITADSAAIEKTVTYVANKEAAKVTYIDDTTGKTLSSQDLSGDYGTTDSYRTADSIKGYEDQGYQLVSDNYPTNGVVYNQDGTVQSFEVHLTHGTTPVGPNNPQTPGEPINPDNPDGPKWPEGTDKSSLTQTVIRTVNYLDKQTGKVVAKQVTEQVTYNRTAIVDKVTGQIIGYSTTGGDTVDQTDGDKAWTAVDNKSDWDSVTSPDLGSKGYLAPDLATVAQQTVTPGDKDVTVNVYYDHDVVPVNPTNPQTPGTPINPDDPDSPKWPAGTDKNSLTTDVHQTIHYQYGDGSQAAPDKTDSTTFDHQVEIDKVTGEIVKDDGWTSENGKTSFDSKNSPVIPGYTASKLASDSVDGLTHDSKDNVQTIVYTKNPATDNNGGTEPNQPGKPGNGTDTGNPSSNQLGNPSQPSNATNNGVINTSTNTESKVNNGAVNSPELPQTGENISQSQTMSFIGILLAMFGSLLGFLGIKKRRND